LNFLIENAENNEEKNFEAFKVFVEKNGKPFNYMTSDTLSEEDRVAQL
jgi:hypothetical protein